MIGGYTEIIQDNFLNLSCKKCLWIVGIIQMKTQYPCPSLNAWWGTRHRRNIGAGRRIKPCGHARNRFRKTAEHWRVTVSILRVRMRTGMIKTRQRLPPSHCHSRLAGASLKSRRLRSGHWGPEVAVDSATGGWGSGKWHDSVRDCTFVRVHTCTSQSRPYFNNFKPLGPQPLLENNSLKTHRISWKIPFFLFWKIHGISRHGKR